MSQDFGEPHFKCGVSDRTNKKLRSNIGPYFYMPSLLIPPDRRVLIKNKDFVNSLEELCTALGYLTRLVGFVTIINRNDFSFSYDKNFARAESFKCCIFIFHLHNLIDN
jgi:hypothetical protein